MKTSIRTVVATLQAREDEPREARILVVAFDSDSSNDPNRRVRMLDADSGQDSQKLTTSRRTDVVTTFSQSGLERVDVERRLRDLGCRCASLDLVDEADDLRLCLLALSRHPSLQARRRNRHNTWTSFWGQVTLHTDFNFPFYRLSYLFRFVDTPRWEFQGGLTGQIRNANYTYEQTGVRFARNSDVGFTPALKLRARYTSKHRVYLGLEADGIYAPISVLNGSSNDTVGAILDASLRVS